MSKPVFFHLSALDQAMMRVYIRYCLCFPCENESPARDGVAARLRTAVRNVVAKMPILAGSVSSADTPADSSSEQAGRLEIRLSLDELNAFQPIVKILGQEEFPYTYESLAAGRVSPARIMSHALTPLQDWPGGQKSNPAFAVQGSFIEGGFLVAIYVHHSVADIQGIAEVIKHMSNANGASPSQLTQHDLESAASQQSKLREQLAGIRSVRQDPRLRSQFPSEQVQSKAIGPEKDAENGTQRILAFRLDKITSLKERVNERGTASADGATAISAFSCLAAILWTGITRARFPHGGGEDSAAILLVPFSIRKKLEPPLDDSYYGNACRVAFIPSQIPKLRLPYEESLIKEVAEAIGESFRDMNDGQVRSFIDRVNAVPDVRVFSSPSLGLKSAKLVVSSWEGVPTGKEASLGLGLGAPQYSRMISREHTSYYCVVHPRKREENFWEVNVQLPVHDMRNLLVDDGFMQFVKWVSE
ncbi:hypothetical protein G7Y89_g8489 [Cudoniella acicularis]|uniref:Uncharacterized protein n=1 Tax=Cudoniella acicularis TaxID=354080 RepID=A0A8H4RGJ3_9HELO|nr:hypothetical protein G7Y89_g8489 [Cudoniella acicularis]